jgi:hypothetical protein
VDVYSNQMPANIKQELRVNKFMIAEGALADNAFLSLNDLLNRKTAEEKEKLLHSPKEFVRYLREFIGVKKRDIKKWCSVLKRKRITDILLKLC